MAHISWSPTTAILLHRVTGVTPRCGGVGWGGYPARRAGARYASRPSLRHHGGCWVPLDTTGTLGTTETTADKALFVSDPSLLGIRPSLWVVVFPLQSRPKRVTALCPLAHSLLLVFILRFFLIL